MRKQFRYVLAMTAVLALSGGLVTAQQDRARTGSTAEPASRDQKRDEKFLTEAARRGLADAELARVAAQRASIGEVKQFAAQVAEDQDKTHSELSAIAAQRNVPLPTEPSEKDRKEAERLSKLEATELDREYIRRALDSQKKQVSEFRKAAKSAGDDEVKMFALAALPTFEEHVRVAQRHADAMRPRREAPPATVPGPRPDPGSSGRPAGPDSGGSDPFGPPRSPGAPGPGGGGGLP